MSDTVVRVEGLGKKYLLHHQAAGRRYVVLRDVLTEKARAWLRGGKKNGGHRETLEEFWALQDVSFEVKLGDVVGIIGRNGAGKSTLLKLLSRITQPTKGRIEIEGRVASLLEVGTGFHPELTGRENVFLNGAILGMNRVEIRRKFDEIVAFAEVEKFLDTPVKRYSSGMYMRLAFAVAAHLEPEILIVDEVLAVGDAEFQKKCLGKMKDVSKGGRTVLFVSHNMAAVQNLCRKGLYLQTGRVVVSGDITDVVEQYAQTTKSIAGGLDKSRRQAQDPACDIIDGWIETGGKRSGVLKWDQPFNFILVVEVRTTTTCSPEFLIRDANGTPILFAPLGLYNGFIQTLAPGSYKISAACSGLKLACGFYTVDAGLAETGKRFYAYYEAALQFELADMAYGTTGWHFTQKHQQGSIPLWLEAEIEKL